MSIISPRHTGLEHFPQIAFHRAPVQQQITALIPTNAASSEPSIVPSEAPLTGRISPIPAAGAASSSAEPVPQIRREFQGFQERWNSFKNSGNRPMLICLEYGDGTTRFQLSSLETMIRQGYSRKDLESTSFVRSIETFNRETEESESREVVFITDKEVVALELKRTGLTFAEREELQPFFNTVRGSPGYLASAYLRPKLQQLLDRVAPYNAKKEYPILHFVKKEDGYWDLDCKSTRELAGLETFFDPQDYVVDIFAVAKKLTELEGLTAREKRALRFFTTTLKEAVKNQQYIDTSSSAKLSPRGAQALLKALTPPPFPSFRGTILSHTGGTYAHAQVGVNVCDYVKVYPALGTAVLIDGPSHALPELVEEQFPYYAAIAKHSKHFVQEFDFTQPGSAELFRERAQTLDWTYQQLFVELQEKHQHHKAAKDAVIVDYKRRFAAFVGMAGQERRSSFTETDFFNLRSLINMEKVDNQIELYERVKSTQQLDEAGFKELAALKALEEGVFATFQAITAKTFATIQSTLRTPEEDFNGPAALIAQVLDTPDGMFLHTLQWSDCCYAIFQPDGNVIWEKQNDRGSGICPTGRVYVRAVIQRMIPLQPNSIVFGFTDGIGEYLTREELIAIIRTYLAEGVEAIQAAIKAAIAKHQQKEHEIIGRYAEDSTRMQASNPMLGCRRLDPTGKNKMYFDDTGFFIIVTTPATLHDSPNL